MVGAPLNSNVSNLMKRAIIALFLTPLLASIMFGMFALVVFPFMLVVTLFIALPLLLTLRKFEKLNWWHALLSGSFCGACYVAIDTLLSYFSYAPNLDRLANSNNLLYVGLGAAVGFTFWWIGIFRNPAFPFVSPNFPRSIVVVLPLAVVAVLAHKTLQSTYHEGRVIAVLKNPHLVSGRGLVSVRLTEKSTVQADIGTTWPLSMVQGKCFHIEERWSTFRFHRVYELISPFGGDVDDC